MMNSFKLSEETKCLFKSRFQDICFFSIVSSYFYCKQFLPNNPIRSYVVMFMINFGFVHFMEIMQLFFDGFAQVVGRTICDYITKSPFFSKKEGSSQITAILRKQDSSSCPRNSFMSNSEFANRSLLCLRCVKKDSLWRTACFRKSRGWPRTDSDAGIGSHDDERM